MTTNEHLDRIETTLHWRMPPQADREAALESLSVLREHIRLAEKDRDVAEQCQTVLGNEHRILRDKIAALTIERDQQQAVAARLYAECDVLVERIVSLEAALRNAPIACPNCDSACNPDARACWKCNAWLEAASTPQEDAPRLAGLRAELTAGPVTVRPDGSLHREYAFEPQEDAPALTGSQRGEGSGPLPGRNVTVVQTGEKTLFVTGSPDHTYTSTACYHGLHDRCRRECKFCSVACGCVCHESVGDMARRLW